MAVKRLLLALALLILPAWASVVQGAGNGSGSGGADSQAFSSNNTLGNLIIACAVQSVSGGTNTFTDTNLNSYRNPATGSVGAASQVPYNSSASSIACAYAENIATGANTVSYTNSNASCNGFCAINIVEISGTATSSSLDQFVSNANATSGAGADNETSTAKVTTVNGELIYGYSADSIGVDSAGTGFSFTPNNVGSSETLVQSSLGSIAATVTSSHGAGDTYAMLMITFKPVVATPLPQIAGKAQLAGTATLK